MLVLTRRISEALLLLPSEYLGPDMTVAELFWDGPVLITVDEVRENQASIGIEAPRIITVLRKELA